MHNVTVHGLDLDTIIFIDKHNDTRVICLTDIINSRVAQLLLKDRNTTTRQASRLTSGGGIFEVNSSVDFDIRFFKPDIIAEIHGGYIIAQISPDIRTDLIIGLPTIRKYNLLNLPQSHLDTYEHLCKVCSESDTLTLCLQHN